jgi:hypothetical protein
MILWHYWWEAICLLRPAFSRLSTFMWFTVCVAGLTIRTDKLGVTSVVRALGLQEKCYGALLDSFHSNAIKLDQMSALWFQIVRKLFPEPVRFNGRLVLVGDGIKVSKEGKKMPGVKHLHQSSDSNTKAEYIMGHSYQAVSLLCHAAKRVFAVPLASKRHEGIVLSNRDKRTLLDKMLLLLATLNIEGSYYFVADAYYANGKTVNGLLANGNHLVTRARSNAVAYYPYVDDGIKRRGRPRIYGEKVALKDLLADVENMIEIDSPVYGDKDIKLKCATYDLLWKPVGKLVRFVVVVHPTRGSCILMSSDLDLKARDIIHIYGLRFKIEFGFKQSVHVIGGYGYHFWMKTMKSLKKRNGDQYLHRESKSYRDAVARKIKAYHVFVMAGIVAQGLLQYLSTCYPKQVWASFGSWLRTIRSGIPPSELVVATALRHSLPEFLLDTSNETNLAKFIKERQDLYRFKLFRRAS